MAKVKAWKQGAAGEPDFPSDFEVLKKQVLQKTDIAANNNKYYCLELHQGEEDGSQHFRVFTHYGRTGDLEGNPNAGVRESRYLDSQGEAQAQYEKILKQKTSKSKGYQEVNLASSNIGSDRSRGQSTGEMDEKTLQKIAEQKKGKKTKKKAPKKSTLSKPIQDFVTYIYDEATNALTSTVNAKITANGIETPLGVLTVGQVEKGQEILEKAYDAFNKKSAKGKQAKLEQLSGEFYTVIPHRLGRSRAAVQAAVLDNLPAFEAKQETLQLMKDMLQVNGDENVLLDPQIDKKYNALGTTIELLGKKDKAYAEIEDLILSSQIKHKNIKVQAIYSLKRESEWKAYTGKKVGNEKLLLHGSRIKNWVGILSRGLLMPKIVVSMGVNRTDPGWLGHGIYFGDAACTSAFYTTPGKKRRTRLMAVHRVGMGKMKPYKKITFGLDGPPKGFDSCHGVRNTKKTPSQFEDDEYVVYETSRQRQEFLVEFKM